MYAVGKCTARRQSAVFNKPTVRNVVTVNTAVFFDSDIPRLPSMEPNALAASPAVKRTRCPDCTRSCPAAEQARGATGAHSPGGGGLSAADRRPGTASVPRALYHHTTQRLAGDTGLRVWSCRDALFTAFNQCLQSLFFRQRSQRYAGTQTLLLLRPQEARQLYRTPTVNKTCTELPCVSYFETEACTAKSINHVIRQ